MEERKTFSKSLDMNSLSVPKFTHSTAQHSTALAMTLPETTFRAICILNQTHRPAEWLILSHSGKLPMMQDKLRHAHGLFIF